MPRIADAAHVISRRVVRDYPKIARTGRSATIIRQISYRKAATSSLLVIILHLRDSSPGGH